MPYPLFDPGVEVREVDKSTAIYFFESYLWGDKVTAGVDVWDGAFCPSGVVCKIVSL